MAVQGYGVKMQQQRWKLGLWNMTHTTNESGKTGITLYLTKSTINNTDSTSMHLSTMFTVSGYSVYTSVHPRLQQQILYREGSPHKRCIVM